MRALAGGATAAAVGGAGLRAGSQEAEAIVPAVLVGVAAASATFSAGWALREYEVIGSDDPPEGLTLSALADRVYNTVRTRESTNASTFVDNRNILEGANHLAYSEAKLQAIEALNDEETEANVQTAATDANDAYWSTLMTNLLKSWNESIRETQTYIDALTAHTDISGEIDMTTNNEITVAYSTDGNTIDGYTEGTATYTLPDGSTFDVENPTMEGASSSALNPLDPNTADEDGTSMIVDTPDTEQIDYLKEGQWNAILTELEDAHTSVSDGLVTWVETVYSEVQTGSIDTTDLLTPQEQANLMADSEEQYNQAIADLIALNMPVDPDNEATVNIPSIGATVYGTFAVSDESITLEAGNTYDPETDISGDVYFTYDISQGEGEWSDVETGVDGGTVTFTSEPFKETLYRIHTTADETAEVAADDFTDEGDGTFTVDISDQVETAITNVDQVMYYAQTDGAQYETTRLTKPFEILSFEDTEGNEVDSANFERATTPHDDTNYITQEQWDEQQQRTQELIDKYEAETSGGGGGWLPEIGDVGGGPLAGMVIAVLVLFGLASASN